MAKYREKIQWLRSCPQPLEGKRAAVVVWGAAEPSSVLLKHIELIRSAC